MTHWTAQANKNSLSRSEAQVPFKQSASLIVLVSAHVHLLLSFYDFKSARVFSIPSIYWLVINHVELLVQTFSSSFLRSGIQFVFAVDSHFKTSLIFLVVLCHQGALVEKKMLLKGQFNWVDSLLSWLKLQCQKEIFVFFTFTVDFICFMPFALCLEELY